LPRSKGLSGITQIRVDLTAAGKLASASVFSSSENPWLDAAALRSARMTRFKPDVAHCRDVAGSYLHGVEF